MKLGILGGSFNPVHKGHLHIAQAAIRELEMDRVVLVPAYQSPFKLEAEGLKENTAERILMLAAAVAGDPCFAIDDCEIKREGVSYTVHTVEDIIERYLPTGKPYLIIGDDLAADFLKWRDSNRILEIAEVVIGKRCLNKRNRTARAPVNITMANNAREHLCDRQCEVNNEQYLFPHILLNNKIINVSSSTIRELKKDGGDYSALIPSVSESSAQDSYPYFETVLKIEKEVRETLPMQRFLHSRHTALLAHDMCRRFGVTPMDGYLAGIAHDLAKQHDHKELIRLAKKDGNPINALEKEKPGLLHGRAAAVLLNQSFGINNKDILEAVAVHTGGRENMGDLAKIIYIADKVDVSRNTANPKTLDDVANLRRMCYTADLDDILYKVIKKTVNKLTSRELDLSLDTLNLLNKMKEKNN